MPLKIYQRGRIWHCRGIVFGVSVRKSLKVSDRTLAEHRAFAIERRIILESVHGPESQATFASACLKYFEDHPIADGERSQMSAFLKPLIVELGEVPLKGITPAKVQSIARKLYPSHKPQSRNTMVLSPVGAVINHAHKHGFCGPIRIERFREEDARIARPIDREWIDRFRKHAPPHLGALALFCFTTGARPKEACNLRPDQLELDNGVAWSGKTKNGKRRVFEIVPEMAAILRILTPRQIAKGRHAGEVRVFGYAHRQSLRLPWLAACKAAGLDYRSRYEAGRHSFFTQLVSKHGADVVTAAKLGNANPGIILKRYVKANDTKRLAHEVFGTKSAQSKRKKPKIVGKS